MMMQRNGQDIIGFDNGYQYAKTANFMFENGVCEMGGIEPSVKEHTLRYRDRYYKVGEGRAAITDDKVSDDAARLLAMAAMAKELSAKGMTRAEIVLAVGLPFSDYGREKQANIRYYGDERYLNYEYEGQRYSVAISKVFVFPQCYAAIAPRLANMRDDYIVIDIGGKTTDVVYLDKGVPVERRCTTIEKSMVKWMRAIQGEYETQFGKLLPEKEFLKVILGQGSFLPERNTALIRHGMERELRNLELELREREYDLDYTNVIYVGGGASVMKAFSGHRENVAYDCDIHANAKGYEYLAAQMLSREA